MILKNWDISLDNNPVVFVETASVVEARLVVKVLVKVEELAEVKALVLVEELAEVKALVLVEALFEVKVLVKVVFGPEKLVFPIGIKESLSQNIEKNMSFIK
jgi:hypothetical protein